jgi:hypothetical protein
MGSDDRPTDAEYYVLEDLEPDDVSAFVYIHAHTEYAYSGRISYVSARKLSKCLSKCLTCHFPLLLPPLLCR